MAITGELSSVFRLKDGSWKGYITVGVNPDGSYARKYRYGRTRQIVKEKLKAIEHLAISQFSPEKSPTLVGWLKYFCDLQGGKPKTRASRYYDASKIAVYCDGVLLRDFDRQKAQSLFKALREEGLGLSTRRHIYHFLKAALNEALEQDLITRNPTYRLKLEGESRQISTSWEVDEVLTFMEAAKADRFYALYYLLLTQGLRIGEAFGLRWSSVF